MIAELIGALTASVFGIFTIFKKRTPLFYRIVFFAFLTCLVGNIYTSLYGWLWPQDQGGFHVGYLGYMGMFFFLYSSYYGAINSLADGGQSDFKHYRITSCLVSAAFFIVSVIMIAILGKGFWLLIVIAPICLTLYFALKLLIIPDVEMGIIKVMRPYNALILALCIFMLMRLSSPADSVPETVGSICSALLIAISLPAARNGVQKWFI